MSYRKSCAIKIFQILIIKISLINYRKLSFPFPLPQPKLSLGCQPVILPNPSHENDGIGLDLSAPCVCTWLVLYWNIQREGGSMVKLGIGKMMRESLTTLYTPSCRVRLDIFRYLY